MRCTSFCFRRRCSWKHFIVLCIIVCCLMIVSGPTKQKWESVAKQDVQTIHELWFNISRRDGAISNFSALDSTEYSRLRAAFHAGRWASDFVSPFHTHYDINCSAILSGHNRSIEDAKQKIWNGNRNQTVRYPPDRNVSRWAKDCQNYRKLRRFPERPRTLEESAFPMAYILTVHKHAAQVERLFRAIYQPQNVYCFHVDKKAPEDFHEAIRRVTNCFDNVFIASTLEEVQYSGYTRLKADLNCMSDLMDYRWFYVINLCGEDFPLKTNLEIIRQMKAYGGKNDIPGVYPRQDRWFVERTRFHHEFVNGKLVKRSKRKPAPPHGALVYFGNAYYAATRTYVEHVLKDRIALDILQYLSDANSPDEHFWVTINKYPGMPGGYPHSTWASNVRFIKWTNSDEYAPCVGKWVRMVCIISIGYLPYIAKRPHLFMNKIHYEYDPLPLQCMEETLDYRTKVPNGLHDFIPDYPVTDLFQVTKDQKPDHLYRFMKQPTKPFPVVLMIIVFGLFMFPIFLLIFCVCLGCCEFEDPDEFQQRFNARILRTQEQRFKATASI